MKGENTRGGRLGRALAVLFFTWVAASLLFTLIPVESAMRRSLGPVFDGWRALTGLEQHWDMFGTVPHHRSYAVTVEIELPGRGGDWRRVSDIGPVLPGLRELPGHFRYHTFFTRLDDKVYAEALEPYLRDLEAAILEAHPEWRGGRFRVRKAAERIHPLETIRDLGEPSYEQMTQHGPRVLDGEEG